MESSIIYLLGIRRELPGCEALLVSNVPFLVMLEMDKSFFVFKSCSRSLKVFYHFIDGMHIIINPRNEPVPKILLRRSKFQLYRKSFVKKSQAIFHVPLSE